MFESVTNLVSPGRTDEGALLLAANARASITLTVPVSRPLRLSYWCKDAYAQADTYPRYDLYLNGEDTTPGPGANNLNCGPDWAQKKVVIPADDTTSGVLTIRFKASSLPLLETYLLFDDIHLAAE